MTLGRISVVGAFLAAAVAAIGEPAHPIWWANVVTGTGENEAPVLIGQAKWMATKAEEEVESVVPGLTGLIVQNFPARPQNPDQAWYDAQKAPLNVGQLKYISQPFYDLINTYAAGWVAEQMEQSGVMDWTAPYPWTENDSSDDNDYGPANLGQLKLSFCLRFQQSDDGDSVADFLEWVSLGTEDYTIDATRDSDGDGTSDVVELGQTIDPSQRDLDGDGLTDQEELANGGFLNPFAEDNPSVGLSVTVVEN